MIMVGIDPDLSGGVAVIEVDQEGAHHVIELQRMPVIEPPTGGNKTLDVFALHAILKRASDYHSARCVTLENAIVKPQVGKGGGVAMMGSVGRIHQTYGAIKALCELQYRRPGVLHAWPSVWKQDMKLGSDKAKSRELASTIYPSHAKVFDKVKNTGLAEALLLAEWGLTKVNLSAPSG